MGLPYKEAIDIPFDVAMRLQKTWDYINKERGKKNVPNEKNVLSFDEIKLKFDQSKVKKNE